MGHALCASICSKARLSVFLPQQPYPQHWRVLLPLPALHGLWFREQMRLSVRPVLCQGGPQVQSLCGISSRLLLLLPLRLPPPHSIPGLSVMSLQSRSSGADRRSDRCLLQPGSPTTGDVFRRWKTHLLWGALGLMSHSPGALSNVAGCSNSLLSFSFLSIVATRDQTQPPTLPPPKKKVTTASRKHRKRCPIHRWSSTHGVVFLTLSVDDGKEKKKRR